MERRVVQREKAGEDMRRNSKREREDNEGKRKVWMRWEQFLQRKSGGRGQETAELTVTEGGYGSIY